MLGFDSATMSNSWLQIPLSDYEGHMNSAMVQQLRALSDLFAQALASRQPASVAIAGIAGGNGLDRAASFWRVILTLSAATEEGKDPLVCLSFACPSHLALIGTKREGKRFARCGAPHRRQRDVGRAPKARHIPARAESGFR